MGANDDHFTYAMQLATSISLSMALDTAIKLKIFEAIAESGPDARLSVHEIASRLSIHNQDALVMLDRVLRLLASHSIVTCIQQQHDSRYARVYGLAPVANYFIPNDDGASLGVVIELLQDKVSAESCLELKDSVLKGDVPFDEVHGRHVFEFAPLYTRSNDVYNNGMLNHTNVVMNEILERYHGFGNLKCLVDVGGGQGITLNMIVSKHPTINGINFDLPHVTQHAPQYPRIKHVGGDMFHEVPQGDAIFLKGILHDCSDDHCSKLLKNCYNALPDDGKVIVVETIHPFLSNTSSSEGTPVDVLIMTQYYRGKKRTEDEFLALAKGVGFSGVRKVSVVCNLWVGVGTGWVGRFEDLQTTQPNHYGLKNLNPFQF